jgi:hypothetical protein
MITRDHPFVYTVTEGIMISELRGIMDPENVSWHVHP